MMYDTNIAMDADVSGERGNDLLEALGGGGNLSGGNSDTDQNDDIMNDIGTLLGEEPGARASSNEDPFKDPNGMPKDPQTLLRELQSQRDSARAELKKMNDELKEYKPVADFVSSLYDDEEARMAFIGELAPDLVKPKDPLSFIQERLKKEFGEDFTPNDEEAGKLGSKTWLYNEMARDLLTEWKEKKAKTPANLKSLTEKRRQAQTTAQREIQRQKDEVLKKFNWDEATYNTFAEWGTKVRQIHLAGIWDKAVNKGQSRRAAPSLATTPGGGALRGSKVHQELEALFGPAPR